MLDSVSFKQKEVISNSCSYQRIKNNSLIFEMSKNRISKMESVSQFSVIWEYFKKTANPVDTGRRLNVHKTFRRRPGRLLNVWGTFNLRPVSTGKALAVPEKLSETIFA